MVMLSVFMLSAATQNNIMLSGILLNGIVLSFVMLSVIMLSVVAPFLWPQKLLILVKYLTFKGNAITIAIFMLEQAFKNCNLSLFKKVLTFLKQMNF